MDWKNCVQGKNETTEKLNKETKYKAFPHIEYDIDRQTFKYKVIIKIIHRLEIKIQLRLTQVTCKNKLIYTDFALLMTSKDAWM